MDKFTIEYTAKNGKTYLLTYEDSYVEAPEELEEEGVEIWEAIENYMYENYLDQKDM